MSKYIGLSTLEVLKNAKNYNKWIADKILAHIETPAIEIGAGIGNLTSYFLDKKPLYATDVDIELVSRLKKRFKHKNILIDCLDITKKIPVKYRSFFATVFSINVLEHIEDDNKALENMNLLLKKGGRIVLLVPAKKYAFTKLDKELGHYRRYEKSEIINKLNKAGFVVENATFLNIVGLLSWFMRSKLEGGNVKLKSYQVRIFDFAVPFLRVAESFIKIPVGISLVVVATKTKKE